MTQEMDKPFLIAHKVRGLAAFDVAVQMIVPGYEEPWWIISTSGHRAYPYWYVELDSLQLEGVPSCPEDWPDHYRTASKPRSKPKPFDDSLTLEDLDL